MHNISKQTIQDLAAEIVELCLYADNDVILHKSRELYEMTVLYNHLIINEISIANNDSENIVPSDIPAELETKELNLFSELPVNEENEDEVVEKESSITDRIKEIMEQATLNQKKHDQEFSQNQEKNDPVSNEIVFEFEPTQEIPIENKKTLPQISREEEMKESIPADIAANMFERIEKTIPAKKSLNDILSQNQIQIGLNDRIAFVKQLFDGNLADFNRVLSQLNSFETESQAKDFLNQVVKLDYNWTDKTEYVERFILLIERRFL